jgi:hypothetical protein
MQHMKPKKSDADEAGDKTQRALHAAVENCLGTLASGKRGVLAAEATIYKDSSVPARAGATICSHSPLPGIGERPGLLRIEKYICLDMENVQ